MVSFGLPFCKTTQGDEQLHETSQPHELGDDAEAYSLTVTHPLDLRQVTGPTYKLRPDYDTCPVSACSHVWLRYIAAQACSTIKVTRKEHVI